MSANAGDNPNELEYAPAPARSRLHPVVTATLAHLASSYLSWISFLVASYVLLPAAVLASQPPSAWARSFAFAPLSVPLVPFFAVWRKRSVGVDRSMLTCLIAYVVFWPVAYLLFWWMARRPRRQP
jgi:hypothetical protein